MGTNGASSDCSEGDGNSNANATSSSGRCIGNSEESVTVFNCADSCEHSYCQAKRDTTALDTTTLDTIFNTSAGKKASRLITHAQYVEDEARKVPMVILYGPRKFNPLCGSITFTI